MVSGVTTVVVGVGGEVNVDIGSRGPVARLLPPLRDRPQDDVRVGGLGRGPGLRRRERHVLVSLSLI